MTIYGFRNPIISLLYIVAMGLLAIHLSHGFQSLFQSLGLNHPRWTPLTQMGWAGVVAVVIFVGNSSMPLAVLCGAHRNGRAIMKLDSESPRRPAGREVDATQVRHEAGQPGQQAQVHAHRGRHRPGRRRRRRRRWPSWATTSSASASRTARAAPTASPPRAASTPPRTIRTTAIAFIASSTTPSRAATSARARPTSIAWPKVSVNIIDQCVAQGVPFARVRRPARQPLLRRRPGVAHLLLPRPDRPATAARRLPGAEPADRAGKVKMYPRTEMLDLVVVDGRARGIVTRDLVTGQIESFAGDAVVLATGGYGNVYYLSTNAVAATSPPPTAPTRRGPASPTPATRRSIPTCIPVTGDHQSKLTLMSESLRNDGRVWVPQAGRRQAAAGPDPRRRARLLSWSASTRASATCARATSPAGRPSRSATRAAASARPAAASTSTSPTPSAASAHATIAEKYGNLFDMYAAHHRRGPLPGADAHLPRPALHHGRAVGGLQPDEQPARPVRPRRGQLLRPRRQPPRRQRPDAGAGRRLLRHPLHDRQLPGDMRKSSARRSAPTTPSSRRPRRTAAAQIKRLLGIKGKRTVTSFHRELGQLMWENCGMARNEAGLRKALARIPDLAKSSGETSTCWATTTS